MGRGEAQRLNAQTRPTTRIIGIDLARAIAILLVTFNHAMVASDGFGHLRGWIIYPVEFLTQLATPVFLIMFGAMLELVYRRRLLSGHTVQTIQRLIVRALECYGFYLLSLVALFFFQGTYSFPALPVAALFGISVPFTTLLVFYTIALVLAPLILSLRQVCGLLPLVVVSVCIHVFYPVLNGLPEAPLVAGKDYLAHVSGIVYGKGVDFSGPSLVHGLTLVIVGMVFGRALQLVKSQRLERRTGVGLIASMLAFSGGVCAALFWLGGAWEVLSELVSREARRSSHPVYFAMGVFGGLASTCSLILIYDVGRMQLGRSLKVFGRNSLFVFGFGILVVNLAPADLLRHAPFLSASLLTVFTLAVTLVFDRFRHGGRFSTQRAANVQAAFNRLLDAIQSLFSWIAGQAAAPYALILRSRPATPSPGLQ